MSDYAFNYSFNITGNASTAAQQITGDVTALNNTVKQATGIWDSFAGKVVAFNQLSQFVEGFSRTVDETLAPGTNCCSRSSPRNLPKLRTPSKLWGTISPY